MTKENIKKINMKTIINYSTSGLGNRLRPLSSCYAISKHSGRTLKVYWDNITPNGCLAKWDELFENQIDLISLEEMENLSNCLLLTEGGSGHGFEREEFKFGRPTLKKLSKNNPYRSYDSFSYNDKQDNIIFYSNNFSNGVDKDDAYEFLFNLKPIKLIQEKIDYYVDKLGLNKTIMGIHARGTDFGTNPVIYVNAVRDILKNNPKQMFFLSTEDPEIENILTELYPDNIIIRKKENYIIKEDNNLPWNDHNSFSITTQHAQEAVEDIYLLAHTNITVFHPMSTFAEISRIISNKFK